MVKKLVLSLDGGGIREMFILKLLVKLEHALGLKIHEIFDMVIGVSAGSIVAAAIGQGQDISTVELDLSAMFSGQKKDVGGLFTTLYDGRGKRRELDRIFGNRTMSSMKIPTAILTAEMGSGEAVIFTNSDQDASSIKIAAVVDASSAAPVYFPAVRIKRSYYIDGGIVNNDPVFAGLQYIQKLMARTWTNVTDYSDIAILSIGTGTDTYIDVKSLNLQKFGLVKWLSEGLMSMLYNSRRNYTEPIIRMILDKKTDIKVSDENNQCCTANSNYCRIDSAIIGKLNDTSLEEALFDDVNNLWALNQDKIVAWLSQHRGDNFTQYYSD